MANKNNLDLDKDNVPHHTELSAAYKMGGTSYGLWPIVAAVAGYTGSLDEADDSKPEIAAWNADTMGNRLDKIKAYLKDNNAEPDTGIEQQPAAETSGTDSDGEEVAELRASNSRMADTLDTIRSRLEMDDGSGVKQIVEAIDDLQERCIAQARRLADYEDAEGVTSEDTVTVESSVGARLKRIENTLGIR